jgi:hypothetical protein
MRQSTAAKVNPLEKQASGITCPFCGDVAKQVGRTRDAFIDLARQGHLVDEFDDQMTPKEAGDEFDYWVEPDMFDPGEEPTIQIYSCPACWRHFTENTADSIHADLEAEGKYDWEGYDPEGFDPDDPDDKPEPGMLPRPPEGWHQQRKPPLPKLVDKSDGGSTFTSLEDQKPKPKKGRRVTAASDIQSRVDSFLDEEEELANDLGDLVIRVTRIMSKARGDGILPTTPPQIQVSLFDQQPLNLNEFDSTSQQRTTPNDSLNGTNPNFAFQARLEPVHYRLIESFLKTAPPKNVRDSGKWRKAEDAAKKSNSDDFYALSNYIYQRMGGEFGGKRKKKRKKKSSLLTLAATSDGDIGDDSDTKTKTKGNFDFNEDGNFSSDENPGEVSTSETLSAESADSLIQDLVQQYRDDPTGMAANMEAYKDSYPEFAAVIELIHDITNPDKLPNEQDLGEDTDDEDAENPFDTED